MDYDKPPIKNTPKEALALDIDGSHRNKPYTDL